MAIWKLTPIDLEHRDWQTSSFDREIIVRAESEERAREIATSAFRTGATSPPGKEIPTNPWSQSALVSAAEVKDSNYPETGQEEILNPEEAHAYNNS